MEPVAHTDVPAPERAGVDLERGAIGDLRVVDSAGIAPARLHRQDSQDPPARIREGDVVTSDFDPLLAKMIVHAPTRDMALSRARQALRDFVVLGLRTNAPYLLRVLAHDDVRAGRMHTGWLAEHHERLIAPDATLIDAAALVAARHRQLPREQQRGATGGPTSDSTIGSPWETLGGWRG